MQIPCVLGWDIDSAKVLLYENGFHNLDIITNYSPKPLQTADKYRVVRQNFEILNPADSVEIVVDKFKCDPDRV